MASEALEGILETTPTFGRTGMYTTIDVYVAGTAALYTPEQKPNPIGSMGSGLQLGGMGVLRKDLGDGLQERYDWSGHDGTEPHLDYDLLNATKKFSIKALGDAHQTDLLLEDAYQKDLVRSLLAKVK